MIEPKTKTGQRKKFDFAAFKEVATHPSRATRKAAFVEYFEDFHEFPSYLFDNERIIHKDLWDTMQDILKDPATPKDMKKGVDELLSRLPFRTESDPR
jgi:hypothetical protein